MRVLVAGATGVLGRPVVKQLLAGGHRVAGLARSAGNRERLGTLGAEALDCDVFDADALTRAAEGCDAVLHLATKIPAATRTTMAHWAENDRLRRDGTRALLAAAVAQGCRYVQQSVTWVYGDTGGEWVDESAPRAHRHDLPANIVSSVDMEEMVEEAVARHGLAAVILRGGSFYGPEAGQTRMLVARLRAGTMKRPGDGHQLASMIHTEDMAAAVVAATVRETPIAGEILNVVDDEPVAFGALLDHVADRLHAKRPAGVPRWLLRLAVGKLVTDILFLSLRCRNQRLKQRLGLAPRFPTYREGFEQVLAELDG